MFIYIIVAILFGIGVILNLFQESPDWANIGVGSSIVLSMIAMFSWVSWNYKRRHETLRWLRDYKDQITDQDQYFKDSPFPTKGISKKTKLRNFKVVTSFVFFTTTHDVGGDLRGSIVRGVIATLWTLVFGWWGLPWGPLNTIQALVVNFSGGEKQTANEAMLTAEAALKLEAGEH